MYIIQSNISKHFSAPYDCPSTWGEWSDCNNCMRTRTRTCHDSCGDTCNKVNLQETDICGDCTTTEPPTPSPTTGTAAT